MLFPRIARISLPQLILMVFTLFQPFLHLHLPVLISSSGEDPFFVLFILPLILISDLLVRNITAQVIGCEGISFIEGNWLKASLLPGDLSLSVSYILGPLVSPFVLLISFLREEVVLYGI